MESIAPTAFATVDSYVGRDRTIAAHLDGMTMGERHRINGLVVQRVSARDAWVYHVGDRRHVDMTTAIRAIKAAGEA